MILCENFKRHARPFLARMAAKQTDLEALLAENFSCKICSQILSDPVQCQNKEHYYCRGCITSRLRHAKTCPLCKDDLSLETLRPPSRIVADVVSKLKKPGCSHVSRGCTENVKADELLLHEQKCGYAPVVCSNEGCKQTVNRRVKESHETKECKFRKITCESCQEEMSYGLYQMHLCSLREEFDRMKSRLAEASKVLEEISDNQANLEEKLETYEMFEQSDYEESLSDSSSIAMAEASASPTALPMEGQIFIISGGFWRREKSVEVFDWSTRTWTYFQDCLRVARSSCIAFVEGNKIMIYGGQSSRKFECLTPSENGITSTLLQSSSQRLGFFNDYNGVKYGNRIITFYRDVVQTNLEPPYYSTTLVGESYTRLVCGVVQIGNSIYIIGGQPSRLERYDVAKNKMELLSPVPYEVSRMACVAYKDNIIIIGGEGERRLPLNDVMMYNVTTQKYKKLPSMLEQRVGCSAVIKDGMIVVMGGGRRNRKNGIAPKKSAEYHVIGEDAWHELPNMHEPRAYATAIVYK